MGHVTTPYPDKFDSIANRIGQGIKFGIFEDGSRCYFQDGFSVRYSDLWKSILQLKGGADVGKKSLFQIYPEIFVGTHSCKYAKYNW